MSLLQSRIPWKALFTVGALGSLGYTAFDILTQDKSQLHTKKTIVEQYAIFRALRVLSARQRAKFDDATLRAAEESEKTLLSIIQQNALTGGYCVVCASIFGYTQ